MKRIALVGANPFSGNYGVAALGYSMLHLVTMCAEERNVDIAVDFYGVKRADKFVVMNGVNYPIRMKGMYRLDTIKGLIKAILNAKGDLFPLLGVDLALDVSEGDSFSDIYGAETYRNVTNMKRIFSVLKARQILMPQTVGPFSSKDIAEDAAALLRKMSVVLVRDNASKLVVDSMLGAGFCREIVDCAFALPYVAQNDGKSKIGLNVSALLINSSGNNQKSYGVLAAEYPKMVDGIIRYFLDETDSEVQLVPHVFGNECLPIEDDRVVSEMIVEKFKNPRLQVAREFKDPCDAKSYISGMDFFVGARMHACIAAFSSGVPVVPLAYSRKFTGLFVDTLGYPYVGDLVNESHDGIMMKIKEAYENRDLQRQKISAIMGGVVNDRILELKKIIGDALVAC